jgi:alpha-L-fucosidase
MPPTRREFLQTGAVAAAGSAAERLARPAAAPRVADFQPTWASLAQYQTAGLVPRREVRDVGTLGPAVRARVRRLVRTEHVRPGQRQYVAHLARYGHPSKSGFKDIIRQWRAEEWRPDDLVALYKGAGAQYFMALANHHDNMDLWDSKHQPWNSVRLGRRRISSVAGRARRGARGCASACRCTRRARGAGTRWRRAPDKDGPMAGVPYDGKLTRAQGKGQWWDGLDPQDLYEQRHAPGRQLEWDWDASKGAASPTARTASATSRARST